MKQVSLVSMLCLVSLVAVVSCSDDDIEHHWDHFKVRHPKRHHHSTSDESLRKVVFHKSHKTIQAHNAKETNSFKMGHTKFSDMHPHERKMHLGLKMKGASKRSLWEPSFEDRALPTKVDYRTNKCLQPVQDQGECGSCWTFSALCPLEFSQCKKTGTPVKLSEQQLVDCDPEDGGCDGGYYTTAWGFLKKSGGSAKRGSYQYTGEKGKCNNMTAQNIGAKVASFTEIPQNANAMMKALQNGPISVALTVVDSLYNYESGVYTDKTCNAEESNHAVTCVGYGELKKVPYWIIRNSWGTGWGLNGYFLIKRGVNMCNIESDAASVVAA